MSCFWISIKSALNADECKKLGVPQNANLATIIKAIKMKNRSTGDVLWQGQELSPRNLAENLVHVATYRADSHSTGYWTSSCDPFLLLLAQLLRWKIIHEYAGEKIMYKHTACQRHVRFRSSRTHFSYVP